MPIIHYPQLVYQSHPKDLRFQDLSDKEFGRLTVLGYAGVQRHSHYWFCLCKCGRLARVARNSLSSNNSRSCGCLSVETCRMREMTHGATINGIIAREYAIYKAILARCTNPNTIHYGDYGGRGIGISQEWRGKNGYVNFLAHVGNRPSPKHSIDRIDNDGNYEPGNVRWATWKEQARNKRNNRLVQYQKRQMSLPEASEMAGLPYKTVHARLQSGWSDEKALTTPVRCARKGRS